MLLLLANIVLTSNFCYLKMLCSLGITENLDNDLFITSFPNSAKLLLLFFCLYVFCRIFILNAIFVGSSDSLDFIANNGLVCGGIIKWEDIILKDLKGNIRNLSHRRF